jgi:protein TonB
MDVVQTEPKYQLKSELARVCLPSAHPSSERKLAWVNSLCLLFLLIGIIGARSAPPPRKPVKPLEEPVAVIVEPPPPPPPTAEEQPKQEQTETDKSDAPRVVVVTPESPAINFSIPTIGNILVPNAIAAAPPEKPLQQLAPLQHNPVSINSTGEGGDRPDPPYPKMALQMGQQGSVGLLMTVDDNGIIVSIAIKSSSGSPILDQSAKDFVRRHWIVPPGKGSRVYEAKITYKLQSS